MVTCDLEKITPVREKYVKSICFVTASPMTLRAFMRNHLLCLSGRYEVSAVADFTEGDLTADWFPGVRLVSVPIARRINLLGDLKALWELYRYFRARRFDAVHSVTPKAGLLAMIAARLAGIPHRIHCFTGQVWATQQGLGRELLKNADRLIAANATHVLADSHSQLEFLVSEHILRPDGAEVLGHGSISGVDVGRFRPDAALRASIRQALGVPKDAFLLLFVGRLNRDKGVLDLADAFARLTRENNASWLLMVGPDDEEGIAARFEQRCGSAMARVRRIDYTSTPEHYMAAADVFVLPSYREGFGSVVIEAAACGIPAVASRIYGLTDAVEEGATGLLQPAGDVNGLYDNLLLISADSKLRAEMGERAQVRANAHFSMISVTAALSAYYEGIFGTSA
ncbi:MAG: glycosyltransferase family 4 protein [Pseudomonadota bacterium]